MRQNVTNFALPTMWFSELPFYTGKLKFCGIIDGQLSVNNLCNFVSYISAVQIQQGWAYGNKVNLLAAGASNAQSTGSGIYSGSRGALKAVIVLAPTTKVLVAKIPKIPGAAVNQSAEDSDKPLFVSGQKLWKENLDKYKLQYLDFTANVTRAGMICDGTICCQYNITVSTNAAYTSGENKTVMLANTITSFRYFIELIFSRDITRTLWVFSMAFVHLVMEMR